MHDPKAMQVDPDALAAFLARASEFNQAMARFSGAWLDALRAALPGWFTVIESPEIQQYIRTHRRGLTLAKPLVFQRPAHFRPHYEKIARIRRKW